jgi:hypothetical protein
VSKRDESESHLKQGNGDGTNRARISGLASYSSVHG